MRLETRAEKFLMGFCMSASMIIFMCSMNKFQMEGINADNIVQILVHYPLEIVFVMLLSDFVAAPLVGKLLPLVAGEHESRNAMIFFRTFFSVIIMSMIMTICGPVIGRVGADYMAPMAGYSNFFSWAFCTWINRWRMNFTMALLWNLACAGPFSRWVVKTYRAKSGSGEFQKKCANMTE